MKKIWISVCIFAVIAFSFTGVLIHLNNAKISKENDELNHGEEFYEDSHANDYKLATTEEITFESGEVLKENAIIFEDISLPNISEGNIFQIKGLKDEKVQDRVNKDIKNKVSIKISDISEEENFKSFKSIAYDIKANFSNIISASVNIKYMQKDDSENDQYVYLNYELVNGNRLKISDLLKKDTEITDIVREYLYKYEMRHGEDDEYSSLYYDRENDVWRWEGHLAWHIIYVNKSEQEINKNMLKFEKNNQENEFYISSYEEFIPDIHHISEVCIFPDICIPEIAYLGIGDLPDQITVANKYLTTESLYKDDTIAEKNKISNMLKTIVDKKNSDLLTDNFYYKRAETYFDVALDESGDLDIYDNGIAKYSINDNLKKVDDKYIKWFFDEVEKCKEIALNDSNNFYAIISTSRFFGNDFSNIFDAEVGLYKIVVPIERKNEIIETIYDVFLDYGRENDFFWDYRTHFWELDCTNAYSDKLIELSTEHLVFLSGLYDVRTLQPVESIVDHDEKDFNVVYVLPGSDKLKITKSDIENFSLDELNKAYNEIFARHGHDFTNKELKDFFWGMIWYTPISGKTVSLDELSEVEKYNLNIIKEVVAEKKK